jgi:hypothetical protein
MQPEAKTNPNHAEKFKAYKAKLLAIKQQAPTPTTKTQKTTEAPNIPQEKPMQN